MCASVRWKLSLEITGTGEKHGTNETYHIKVE